MSATRDRVAATLVLTIPLVMRAMAHGLRRAEPTASPAHLGALFLVSQGPRSLTELASWLAISAPTASASIDTLEARGWVTRERSPHDRRAVVLRATDAGMQVLRQMREHAESRLVEVLEALSEDDCERLLAGLEVLRRAWPQGATPSVAQAGLGEAP